MGWFGKRAESGAAPAAPRVPADTRVYCVGDIHGRADLLRALHPMIEADGAGFDGSKQVVYLGDYIDRGDDSRGVIEHLLAEPLPGCTITHLRGNHEQALLDFLRYPERAAQWLDFGGLATLLSYGVRLDRPPWSADMPAVAAELERCLPEAHREFLERTGLWHRAGDYLFVHAGIRPGIGVEQQHPEDLMWIREEFLEHPGPHEGVVVHGHSISDEVEMLPQRIGLDTGAFYSGVLSCLVLEGSDRRLLQTRA